MDIFRAIPRANMPTQTKLAISPGLQERLDAAKDEFDSQPSIRVVPKSPERYSAKLHYVDTAEAAAEMLDFVGQRPLSAIGIDTEFRYSRPGVLMKRAKGRDYFWNDPRSVEPLLLSIAAVEIAAGGGQRVYPFVVDARREEVRDAVRAILHQPLPFVGHFLQAELMCFWALDLPVPQILWDTWAAEKAFSLGLYHAKYEEKNTAVVDDELAEMLAKEAAEGKVHSRLRLTDTCRRRGVHYPFAGGKKRLQKLFLDHQPGQSFSAEQLEYAATDAIAAVALYPAQVQVAVQQGCLRHLETLEMPWVVTNARMIWDGVFVDPGRLSELRQACAKHIAPMRAKLASMGLENVNSPKQVKSFFQTLGLIELFRQGEKYVFDDKQLKAAKDRHPAIPKIRMLRKITRLLNDKLLTGELVGADGRLHPDHRQLGSESGRNAMRWPNVGGLGRALRPLVVPEPGFAIGEVDLCQIEVGIAAAVYHDVELIEMFNSKDVYVAMAKRFYADKLTPEEMSLPDELFKKQCAPYRDKMKTYTLAIIYGITAIGLALQLGIHKNKAEKERERFLGMFPQLTRALQEAAAYGAIRGCAYLCSGLRRQRGRQGRPSNWERNWLMNSPVQGSANIAFRAAGNRLRLRYEHYGAKLILPMHDAFVFECPRRHLQAVAKITAEVMRSTVQEYFPALEPRVDINIDHPECWNKDAKYRSLRLWMVRPEFAFR